jgi:hypothetical protein
VQAFGLSAVFVGIACAFTIGAVGLLIVIATRARVEEVPAPTPSPVA